MSKSSLINSIVVTSGKVQYFCALTRNEELYNFSIARIQGYKEKDGYKLADPVYSVDTYYKPDRKQMRIQSNSIASIDAKKYQSKEEKKS